MDIINPVLALISIVLGLFGWLAPRYTMAVLDLEPGPSLMGHSEIRASAGALFVGLGIGAIILGSPTGYAMVGFAWGGAAVGRLTSLILDSQTPKKWGFFVVEAGVAAVALGLNL